MRSTLVLCTLLAACLALAIGACSPSETPEEAPSETPEETPEGTPAETPEATPVESTPEADTPAEGQVELTSEGNRFDPPVAASQIPDGSWYCDMGTVHFASSEQGEGSCPICGMNLVLKATEGEEEAPAPAHNTH